MNLLIKVKYLIYKSVNKPNTLFLVESSHQVMKSSCQDTHCLIVEPCTEVASQLD